MLPADHQGYWIYLLNNLADDKNASMCKFGITGLNKGGRHYMSRIAEYQVRGRLPHIVGVWECQSRAQILGIELYLKQYFKPDIVRGREYFCSDQLKCCEFLIHNLHQNRQKRAAAWLKIPRATRRALFIRAKKAEKRKPAMKAMRLTDGGHEYAAIRAPSQSSDYPVSAKFHLSMLHLSELLCCRSV